MTNKPIIAMHEESETAPLPLAQYALAFIGPSSQEDRSHTSKKICGEFSSSVQRLSYNSEELSLHVGEDSIECSELAHSLRRDITRVLLDATTLGTVELASAIKALLLNPACETLDVLYVEPADYTSAPNSQIGAFQLSEKINGYIGVPSLSHQIDEGENNRYIFFVGYEAVRLVRAFEEQNVNKELSCLVFGVPAFRPAWEANAFSNNIRAIGDYHLKDRILFAAADNPQAVLDILQSELMNTKCDKIVISPIGTKPHAIGASVFLSLHPERASLLYDHPVKHNSRSVGTGKKHLFRLKHNDGNI